MKKSFLFGLSLILGLSTSGYAQSFIGKECYFVDAPSDIQATLTFDAQAQRVFGFSGVNRFFGPYNLDASKKEIQLGPLASTMMAGPEEAMTFESDFLKKLNSTTSYFEDDETLILKTPSGDLIFKSVDSAK